MAAYGEIGVSTRSISENETFALFPYTDDEEPKMKAATSLRSAHARRFAVPVTFTSA